MKKISGGTQYRFIGGDNEKENIPKLETQEAPQLQKYDEVNSQNLRSNYKISKKAPASYIREGFQNLLFKSNQKAILIHLLPSPQELPLNKETNLPETIDIQIIKRDSLEWEMNWYINKGFLNYDPSQMEITIKDQTMYVAILKNYIYTIDTDNNNTKAILEK